MDLIVIFHFGLFFLNQNFKKMKKMPGDIINLHMCTKNYDQMIYSSWNMVCDRCNCYFSLWAIFCIFYPPNSPKNQNFQKMKKKMPGDIILLHICTKNYDQMMYGSWDVVHDRQTDRWTDGRTEKVTYRGGCPT